MLPKPLPPFPIPWTPSHKLTWVPASGLVRSWIVRVIRAGEVSYGQTLEEHRAQLPPRWVRIEATGVWSFDGRPGYLGQEGAVREERLAD